MTGVVYNNDDHTATLDGKPIGRVTSIIRDAGFGVDPKFYGDGSAALRGTEAHDAIHFDNKGTLDEATVKDEVWPYLFAWRDCKSVLGFTDIENELDAFNRQYWYCGQCDMRAKINGKVVIVDFKTGVPTKHDCLQTAAYAFALGNADAIRMGIYLKKDGTWRPKYHDKSDDTSVFLSCVNIYNRKLKD